MLFVCTVVFAVKGPALRGIFTENRTNLETSCPPVTVHDTLTSAGFVLDTFTLFATGQQLCMSLLMCYECGKLHLVL